MILKDMWWRHLADYSNTQSTYKITFLIDDRADFSYQLTQKI